MKTDQHIEVAVARDGSTREFRVLEARSGYRYIKVLGENVSLEELAADPELVVRAYEEHEANRLVAATLKLLLRCPKCGCEQAVCTRIELPNALYRAPRDHEHERQRIDYINREYVFRERHDQFCNAEYIVVEIQN